MDSRQQLTALLGKNEAVQVEGSVIARREFDNYVVEELMLTLNTIETVPGIFAYPKNVLGPVPVVLFNHSHGGNFQNGKQELFQSTPYLQAESFGETLLDMGYAVAAIDHFSFGQRAGKKESELVKEFLLTGRTLWGMRIFDSLHFLEYLETRVEVDDTRIATIGMSMGGMMSWWLAALSEKISVCVDIAGQGDLETLIAERGLDHHGFYYYVPHLLEFFTTGEIQKLIAPRPRLSLTGKDDLLCPAHGVEKLAKYLTEVYKNTGVPDDFQSFNLTGGHQETKEMRVLWQKFLQEKL
ncbi:dienelactone hydrolase family protein [Enterococcus timonensis]|uniref:dienelactone hydrolase family protein n=1 Tax=Enterococcus timonensis TaxID=1852364 RepID=UPI000AF8E706|nr:alpha/beta fold hydrolase [Enterococcus timonensis]